MVSVEDQSEYEARCILDAVNDALHDLGREEFPGREEVEAVICIAVRKDNNGGALIGRTSKKKVMLALLEFLTDTGIITREFGAAVLAYWMLEPHATPP